MRRKIKDQKNDGDSAEQYDPEYTVTLPSAAWISERLKKVNFPVPDISMRVNSKLFPVPPTTDPSQACALAAENEAKIAKLQAEDVRLSHLLFSGSLLIVSQI